MNDLLKWLLSEGKRNSEDYSHKERMAWAATAIYTGGALFFAYLMTGLSRSGKLLSFILLVVSIVIFFPFLIIQFRAKRAAAQRLQNNLGMSFKLLEDEQGALPETQRNLLAELKQRYITGILSEPGWTEYLAYAAVILTYFVAIFVGLSGRQVMP